MILASCDPKEIHTTYRGIALPDGTIEDHPYRVVREATREEWRTQAEGGLVVLAASDNWMIPAERIAEYPIRFYEVSTD